MPRNEPFFKRILQWRLFFVVNLLLMLLMGMTFGREFLKAHAIQKEIDALQSQADMLAAKNLSLSELQTAFQTQSFIEREARLKLGMKKTGEEVVIFTDQGAILTEESVAQDTEDPLGLVLTGEEREHVANVTKWWYYFFHRKQFALFTPYDD